MSRLLGGLPATRRLSPLIFLIRPVAAHRASRRSANSAVTGHLAGNATNYCALDAALCLSAAGCENANKEKRRHKYSPHDFLLFTGVCPLGGDERFAGAARLRPMSSAIDGYRRWERRAWLVRRPCHQFFTFRIGCHTTFVACRASTRGWVAKGLVIPAAWAGMLVKPSRLRTAITPSPKASWRIEISGVVVLLVV
jgi:hypothetical protein